jgi:adenylate kinase family enzyme
MLKIYILGGPGSGKTTLAGALSSRFHIPHYELDKLGEKNGMRSAAYIEDAFAMAEQPSWVTEGIFLIWIDPLLHQADYIVLLEVSWPVAAWRIISRHIAKSLRGTNPYPGIKSLFLFLKNTRDYYLNKCSADTAELMSRYLEEYEERVESPDLFEPALQLCLLVERIGWEAQVQRCESSGRVDRPATLFPCTDVLASSDASCSSYLIVLAESRDVRRSNQEQIERGFGCFS